MRVFRGIPRDRIVVVESSDVSSDAIDYLFSSDVELIDLSYASSESVALMLLHGLLNREGLLKTIKTGDLVIRPGITSLFLRPGKSRCREVYRLLCMGEEYRRTIMEILAVSVSSLYRSLNRLEKLGLAISRRGRIELTYTGRRLCRLL